MTNVSLKQTKAAAIAPTEATVTLSQAEVIKLAQSVGFNYVASQSTREVMAAACKKLFAAKVVLGKRKAPKGKESCKVTAAFLEARFPKGLNAKGEPVPDETLGKCASYFKRAVETGEAYNENASKTKAASDTIMVAIKKSGTGAEAAGKLMSMVNKMKEANDELAALAACLVDAIKEAGYEPANVAADEAA